MNQDANSSLYQRPEFKDAARAVILQVHVDNACAQIVSGRLTRREANELLQQTTKELKSLVGADRELFERIYISRMRRLIEQFALSDDEGAALS
jgi:hypothetical protein